MSYDSSLRPESWDSFIGQEKMKSRLRVSIQGARERHDPLDHVLLYGPPGSGKTSLAALIAEEMRMDFRSYVMPLKQKAAQASVLDGPGVIFYDEIHRSPKKQQEELLSVLEDHTVQFDNGQKAKIDYPFTIIGATTELKDVIKPLRDRFTHRPKFEAYSNEEMALIVEQMAERVNLRITLDQACALGRAAAGTPRQARALVFTARDLGTCDPKEVLETCGITADGLTEDHLDYLRALDQMGQIAGVDNLSNLTGQPKDVIRELERLLITKELIEFTPKGRQLLVKGMKIVRDM